MNNKEQAHNTVKLLIVVIVAIVILAIVILAILNPIIMSVMTIDAWGTPLNETKSLLTDLAGSPSTLKHTPEMIFEPNYVLAASDLVERLPIGSDQICMSTGQFEEDPVNGFECIGCEDASDNQRLIYHGSSNQTARLAVICNVNLEELNNNIEAYKLENGDGSWEGTSIMKACEVCEGLGKCCAIVLKRS